MTASFVAPDSWWRDTYDRLNDDGRDQLVAGALSFTSLGEDGLETVPLVPPGWLVAEHEAR